MKTRSKTSRGPRKRWNPDELNNTSKSPRKKQKKQDTASPQSSILNAQTTTERLALTPVFDSKNEALITHQLEVENTSLKLLFTFSTTFDCGFDKSILGATLNFQDAVTLVTNALYQYNPDIFDHVLKSNFSRRRIFNFVVSPTTIPTNKTNTTLQKPSARIKTITENLILTPVSNSTNSASITSTLISEKPLVKKLVFTFETSFNADHNQSILGSILNFYDAVAIMQNTLHECNPGIFQAVAIAYDILNNGYPNPGIRQEAFKSLTKSDLTIRSYIANYVSSLEKNPENALDLDEKQRDRVSKIGKMLSLGRPAPAASNTTQATPAIVLSSSEEEKLPLAHPVPTPAHLSSGSNGSVEEKLPLAHPVPTPAHLSNGSNSSAKETQPAHKPPSLTRFYSSSAETAQAKARLLFLPPPPKLPFMNPQTQVNHRKENDNGNGILKSNR